MPDDGNNKIKKITIKIDIPAINHLFVLFNLNLCFPFVFIKHDSPFAKSNISGDELSNTVYIIENKIKAKIESQTIDGNASGKIKKINKPIKHTVAILMLNHLINPIICLSIINKI